MKIGGMGAKRDETDLFDPFFEQDMLILLTGDRERGGAEQENDSDPILARTGADWTRDESAHGYES